MKTTIKYLMLTLIAVFACVSISSCSKDDDDPNKGIGNYYFQLSDVETNCIDANGNNLADALKSEWISANQADAQGKKTIGKTDNESARAWFNQYINTWVQVYDEAYRGKNNLPENGWIRYSFKLYSDASYGGATAYATIEITNAGARLR